MDDFIIKKITISNPSEIITLSTEDDFSEVFAHTQNGDLIGSFKYCATYEGAMHLQWMFLDKISGYTQRGIGKRILEWVREGTDMPIIVSEDTGQKYEDGSHLTGTGLPFANKMMDLGVIFDNRERYDPNEGCPFENE